MKNSAMKPAIAVTLIGRAWSSGRRLANATAGATIATTFTTVVISSKAP